MLPTSIFLSSIDNADCKAKGHVIILIEPSLNMHKKFNKMTDNSFRIEGIENHYQWKVLIYCDSDEFGGHEVTLLKGLEYLCHQTNIKIFIMISSRNVRLAEALEALSDNMTIRKVDFMTRPGDVFRVLFKSPQIWSLKRRFADIQPDLVVVSQGAIALSTSGLGAAKLLGVPVMSFLPMAHRVSVVRNSNTLAVRLQEFLYQRLYTMPDYYLTICQTTVDQLVKQYAIPRERIFMNYFGLDILKLKGLICEKNIYSDGVRHVALIGRIEFSQKQHDFFMYALSENLDNIPNIVVHVLGDGPDLERLINLVNRLGLDEIIRFEGWSDNLIEWYQLLDLIILPSRFEGVPVVMLEAMYWGVPLVASNIDGMKEMLPDKWLFPLGDGREMIERMNFVFNNNQSDTIKSNREKIINELSVKMFQEGFCESIIECLHSK